ncbi:hypothetical protein MNV49_000413 [Pseudohyphozyma bogoriensis]|nr:hypothetical protein MNV49_000413 [Pseudohyphozyma bogoriensis]
MRNLRRTFTACRTPTTTRSGAGRLFYALTGPYVTLLLPFRPVQELTSVSRQGDQFDADNSNVVRLFATLKKDDPSKQMVYYQAGIGTYSGHNKVKGGISSLMDMAVGSGLGDHVRAGYKFLMQHYRSGDRICLLGFSRGAYTARSLAGFLHKCGLLSPGNDEQILFAYEMYKRNDDEGWRLANQFKKTFSTDVTIHFLGVWDTVASVGFFPRSTLPFSSSTNPSVKHFRHALALNEKRARFKANKWVEELNDLTTCAAVMEKTKAALAGTDGAARAQAISDRMVSVYGPPTISPFAQKRSEKLIASRNKIRQSGQIAGEYVDHAEKTQVEEKTFSARQAQRDFITDVEEVWFAGAHCDVGGGAVPNKTRHHLARIPLRWMIRSLFHCDSGALFVTEELGKLGLEPRNLYPVVLPRPVPQVPTISPNLMDAVASIPAKGKEGDRDIPLPGGVLKGIPIEEEHEDWLDAVAPIHDMLEKKKGWWSLEILPMKVVSQDKEGIWRRTTRPNWGRHRTIRDERPSLHYSVLLRSKQIGYDIQNEVDIDAVWQIVH